jgi:pimeloyl-ACP methyl ester carboxylesterase
MTRAAVILGLTSAALIAAAVWLYTPDADRVALEDTYAQSPSVFLTVAGIRLHVRDTGPRDAPALILLHGFGSSLHTWDAWAETLCARFRVIRFDLPGFGLTGPDPTGDYSDTRAMTIIIALMDALHVGRATFIGNSLGGKLAWQFAAAHPDRIARLVLISPDGFASPGFEYGEKPEVPAFVRLLPYVLPNFLLRMSLLPAFANPAALTRPLLDRYYDMMRAPGVRRAIISRMQQVRLDPPEPLLHRIKAPTLILWGERDAMIPYSNAQDYLRAIAGSRLVSLANLGHVPQEEAPGESLAPVNDFLQPP